MRFFKQPPHANEPASKFQFVGEKVPFGEAFREVSRGVSKYKQTQYQAKGAHPIVDQGKEGIAGYSDDEDGLFTDVPAIVFGDHTRNVKYVEEPFFIGADGVKILKPALSTNARYWYHALRAAKIENLGYSRHFKLLKEKTFVNQSLEEQLRICSNLDAILGYIRLMQAQQAKLDQLVKSRFVDLCNEVCEFLLEEEGSLRNANTAKRSEVHTARANAPNRLEEILLMRAYRPEQIVARELG